MTTVYTLLSIEEPAIIQAKFALGIRPSAIATGVNRSPSTISRELTRSSWIRPKATPRPGRSVVAGGYRADTVHEQRQAACGASPEAWDGLVVPCHGLPQGGLLAGANCWHPGSFVQLQTPTLQVFHETIYTAIYAMQRSELHKEVIGWLRFGHTKRRPRARREDRHGRIPDMVSIHDRPPKIDERLIPGHWEEDLINGAYNRSAVGTLVERTTLFTVLSKVENASAAAALGGFSHVLKSYCQFWCSKA